MVLALPKPTGFTSPLDEQIARMRELLRLMAPESGTLALGAIREAFPNVPLSERVRAVTEFRPQPLPDDADASEVAATLRAASA